MKREQDDDLFALSGLPSSSARWTFLSNHAHVLVCLGTDPEMRVREMALRVGITERAITRILTELEEAGIIARKRVGRRNHYEVRQKVPVRHPLESQDSVGTLLEFLDSEEDLT